MLCVDTKCLGRAVWEPVLEEEMGLELSGVFVNVCSCAGGRGWGGRDWRPRIVGSEGEDKPSGDASVCVQICVMVVEQIQASTSGCAGSVWPGSGFHVVDASLHPVIPGVQ